MSQLPPQLVAKFDQMFMTMTQEAGGLNPFLDTLFSFLQRRTDFYYEAEPGDKMGFPPGYSEQIVSTLSLHAFDAGNHFVKRGAPPTICWSLNQGKWKGELDLKLTINAPAFFARQGLTDCRLLLSRLVPCT